MLVLFAPLWASNIARCFRAILLAKQVFPGNIAQNFAATSFRSGNRRPRPSSSCASAGLTLARHGSRMSLSLVGRALDPVTGQLLQEQPNESSPQAIVDVPSAIPPSTPVVAQLQSPVLSSEITTSLIAALGLDPEQAAAAQERLTSPEAQQKLRDQLALASTAAGIMPSIVSPPPTQVLASQPVSTETAATRGRKILDSFALEALQARQTKANRDQLGLLRRHFLQAALTVLTDTRSKNGVSCSHHHDSWPTLLTCMSSPAVQLFTNEHSRHGDHAAG